MGLHDAPGGTTPPPRSSVAIAYLPELVSSASWSKSMSWVESNLGLAAPVELSRPARKALPIQRTPWSEGWPPTIHSFTARSSVPAPWPL